MKLYFSLMLSIAALIQAIPKDAKIYVAGHNGLVGSAIVRALEQEGFNNIIVRSSKELDLCNQEAVNKFFDQEKPEYIYLAAAKVGGIWANMKMPAQFIYQNLAISANVIEASHCNNAKKLLFLGSSCIYPRSCPQPIKEEYLLSDSLEPTNEFYAIAKIAGIKLCQGYNKEYGTKFISCMPTNLYGPNDYFSEENSHVIPGLIRKIYDAHINNKPTVTLWGTGSSLREFLHVDDLAAASIFLMEHYNDSEIINIGTGTDITIKNLALEIQEVIGYKGELLFDGSKPDGTPRKLLDVSKLNALGFQAQIELKNGIKSTVDWYIDSLNNEPDRIRK